MVVKVNRPTSIPGMDIYKQQQKTNASSQAGMRKDEVTISDEAKQLLLSTKQTDPVRQEKVDQLKEQIQSGQYKVDNHKVADKVYQFWFK